MEQDEKRLKILAFGDLHGDRLKAKELADLAEKEDVDLVIMCGDLVDDNKDIEQLLGIFKKRVLIIPGNHEDMPTVETLSELYQFKNLHGKYAVYRDVGFVGCGFANVGLDALSEEEIFETLKEGYEKVKELSKKRIFVTHNHPSGTIMEKLTTFIPGSIGLKKAIEEFQPDLVLCSHSHETHGMEDIVGKTKVINVGRNGKILEL